MKFMPNESKLKKVHFQRLFLSILKTHNLSTSEP